MHKARECRKCRSARNARDYALHHVRRAKAKGQRPAEVVIEEEERRRLLARVRTRIYRHGTLRVCLECGSDSARLLVQDNEHYAYACVAHRVTIAARLATEAREASVLAMREAVERHESTETRIAGPVTLTYAQAVELAQSQLASMVAQIEHLAAHQPGLPIPYHRQSPLYQMRYRQIVERQLREMGLNAPADGG